MNRLQELAGLYEVETTPPTTPAAPTAPKKPNSRII